MKRTAATIGLVLLTLFGTVELIQFGLGLGEPPSLTDGNADFAVGYYIGQFIIIALGGWAFLRLLTRSSRRQAASANPNGQRTFTPETQSDPSSDPR